ncbi:uncharacterized protein LOC133473567 [Phyllopteryx taeniolatus]|uniref:uncharacterized protein LOC133473567 n=1 Tax=Phyllopteryx taeniolatus TaxID=161469 RepID=UPI002AD530A4|nr:uncharacterized protein LOC133473567 [Phyllopteryx taeniolatus]XP_061621197.1 uncharacterized protein LOC133473567 [Phyllopteryx taeniolatus]XP_061621198.1 uncharacterized protein LOC133473567 [Phyllopteryx taeniolatus]
MFEEKLEKVSNMCGEPYTKLNQIGAFTVDLNRHPEVPQKVREHLLARASRFERTVNAEITEQIQRDNAERDVIFRQREQEIAAEEAQKGLPHAVANTYHIAHLQNQVADLKCQVQNLSGAHQDSLLQQTQENRSAPPFAESTPLRPMTRSQTFVQAPMLAKVDPATGATAMFYKPFSPSDLSVLMQKLPAMQNGGENWLRSVQRAVTRQILTAGDMRALLTHACPLSQLETLMKNSGLMSIMDNEALTREYYLTLFTALNALFPIPDLFISDLVFAPRTDEEAAAYIDRALVEYSSKTGHLPTDSALYSQVFRGAVLKGVPKSVVQAMETNPDLPGADHARWLSHLKHHLRRHAKEKESKHEKHRTTESQLAIMQLQSLKKQEENIKIIPVASVGASLPNVVSECMMYQTGPFMARGAPFAGRNHCFNCGRNGHWAIDCRARPLEGRGRGTRGPPRGFNRRGYGQQRGRGYGQQQQQDIAPQYPPQQQQSYHQVPNQQHRPPSGGQYPQ